jgi:hypothetical protein
MAPKLKPLSDEKDIAAVPVSDPVLVVLDPTPSGMELDEVDVAPETVKTVEKPENDGAQALREQLEASKRAVAEANLRAQEAARQVQDKDRELVEARTRTLDTEEHAVTSGLAAAQAELEAASQAFEAAFESGNAKDAAKAQARIGRASSDIREYEKATAALADRKEREKAKPEPRQEAPRFNSVAEAIDAAPNLMDAERDWLKAHQDVWVDQRRNNELGVAYDRAVNKEGLTRGTPEYFQYLEEFMGYAKKPASQPEERTTIVSAPVSRESRSMNGQQTNNNQIVLSPEQRAMAQSMGISEKSYAQNVLRLQRAKNENPEKYAR